MKENEFFKTEIQLKFTVSFKLWVKIRYILRKKGPAAKQTAVTTAGNTVSSTGALTLPWGQQ